MIAPPLPTVANVKPFRNAVLLVRGQQQAAVEIEGAILSH